MMANGIACLEVSSSPYGADPVARTASQSTNGSFPIGVHLRNENRSNKQQREDSQSPAQASLACSLLSKVQHRSPRQPPAGQVITSIAIAICE